MAKYFKDKKILITGGAGFIGCHLAEALVAQGAQVTILDNLSRGSLDNLDTIIDQIKFTKTDLRVNNSKNLNFFQNQEIIFNLAALNTGVDYDLGRTEVMFENNLLLQMVPLQLAAQAKVKKFIQISSASIYSKYAMEEKIPTKENDDQGEPESSKIGYALAKKMGEKLAIWYAENRGINTCRVRFINVYGDRDHFDSLGHFIPVMIRKFLAAQNSIEVYGDGQQKRSFLYVDDAVAALLLIAEKGLNGQVYNVDSNQEKTVKEVVTLISQLISEKKPEIIFNPKLPTGSQRRMLDNSRISQLGWQPKISFTTGLINCFNDIKHRLIKP